MACPALPDGFDLTDPDVLQHRVPLPEFAELRRVEPVCWIPQQAGIAGFQDEGYWAVTRHADVKYVSTHPELFSSTTKFDLPSGVSAHSLAGAYGVPTMSICHSPTKRARSAAGSVAT